MYTIHILSQVWMCIMHMQSWCFQSTMSRNLGDTRETQVMNRLHSLGRCAFHPVWGGYSIYSFEISSELLSSWSNGAHAFKAFSVVNCESRNPLEPDWISSRVWETEWVHPATHAHKLQKHIGEQPRASLRRPGMWAPRRVGNWAWDAPGSWDNGGIARMHHCKWTCTVHKYAHACM
jgi:hypothetical protein